MSDEKNDDTPVWLYVIVVTAMIVLVNLEAAEVTNVGSEGFKGPLAALIGILFLLLLGLGVVYGVSTHTGPYVAFSLGLFLWAMMPAVLGLTLESDDWTSREWWATGWYWAVGPLPVDFASPTGWEPAVDETDGMGQGAIIMVQFMTVYVVVAGLGLAVAALRRRNEPVEPSPPSPSSMQPSS